LVIDSVAVVWERDLPEINIHLAAQRNTTFIAQRNVVRKAKASTNQNCLVFIQQPGEQGHADVGRIIRGQTGRSPFSSPPLQIEIH
jgi:hypothetical protein